MYYVTSLSLISNGKYTGANSNFTREFYQGKTPDYGGNVLQENTLKYKRGRLQKVML